MSSALAAAEQPGSNPAPAPRHRPRLRWILLGGVAALLLLLWSVGGFEGGSNVKQEPVGQPFSLGPAQLTVRGATAKRSWDGGWNVNITTTCQVSGDSPPDLALLSDEVFALASVKQPVLYSEHDLVQIDPSPHFGLDRDYLSPGLAPMTCVFQGTMPKEYDPRGGIRVAFADLAFGDDSVTGNQDPRWHASEGTHRLQLPVQMLPEQ